MLDGVGPLLGVGGFSLLWEDDVEGGAFWDGVGGALPRAFLLKGGGGGGAEVLCFIPLLEEELFGGHEMSGSEGRWERCCSGGEGLLAGEGEEERPVGGRGAAGRDTGGRRADLPTEPPAKPSGRQTGGENYNSFQKAERCLNSFS